jgi:hypothetical protein
MVDVDSKDEARNILPPVYRARASIVCLNKFTLDESNAVVAHHSSER